MEILLNAKIKIVKKVKEFYIQRLHSLNITVPRGDMSVDDSTATKVIKGEVLYGSEL